MDERERESQEPSAARQAAEEPEPDWASEIRSLRKARGERLKALLGDEAGDGPDEGEGSTT